jgi:phosphopantothenoylcysteine decarboxylase/phosphopantothenate--cysteine ligase
MKARRPSRPNRAPEIVAGRSRRSGGADPAPLSGGGPRPVPGPGPRIALGVTGGIAAYKAAEIVRGLVTRGAEVHVLMTENAQRFITPLTLQTLSGNRVITEAWDLARGADIEHIALARNLEALLVAPATADILAKFAHGIADDFLSTFHLAVTAPVVVAPAMNRWMWDHPATRANLATLRGRGVEVIDPESGDLACGEEGIGRMASPALIVDRVLGPKKKPRTRSPAVASW